VHLHRQPPEVGSSEARVKVAKSQTQTQHASVKQGKTPGSAADQEVNELSTALLCNHMSFTNNTYTVLTAPVRLLSSACLFREICVLSTFCVASQSTVSSQV